nr:MAG TPA: hypothetical protein [Caudoviricetes sp.]
MVRRDNNDQSRRHSRGGADPMEDKEIHVSQTTEVMK